MELDWSSKLVRKYNNFYPSIEQIRGANWILRNLKRLAFSQNLKKDSTGVYYLFNGEKIYIEDRHDFWPVVSEVKVINKMMDNISGESIVADIGAYQGTFSISAATEAGKVYAFEMSPPNFQKLEENLELNSCDNVVAENKAVWDENSEIQADIESGGRSTVDKGEETVEAVTLQSYFQNREFPDFIKIDVEGAEYKILSSSIETLKEHRPKMIIEVHQDRKIKDFDHRADDVLELLDKHGFEYEKINERSEDFHIWVE